MWYIIHEYETFTDENPQHSWQIIGEYEDKRDADLNALELNYNDFCRNKANRFPKKFQRKKEEDFTIKDKQQIVLHVLNNVNEKTGSKNQYWGRGYYIISSDRIKIRKNVKKLTDIHALIRDTPGTKGGTTHDYPSDSESDKGSIDEEIVVEERSSEHSSERSPEQSVKTQQSSQPEPDDVASNASLSDEETTQKYSDDESVFEYYSD